MTTRLLLLALLLAAVVPKLTSCQTAGNAAVVGVGATNAAVGTVLRPIGSIVRTVIPR